MASNMTVTLVLTAARTGATCTLGKYDFVGGRCRVSGPTKAVMGAANYMGKCYAAFIEGSEELKEAQAKWDAFCESQAKTAKTNRPATPKKTEAPDGERDIHTGGEPDASEKVHGDAGSDGEESAEVPESQRAVDAGAETGDSGGVPGGDRHQDTRVPPEPDIAKRELIEAALSALDHGNDDHWTQEGKPAVAVVTDVAGENISRQMIEVVAPEFVRVPPQKN